MTDTRKAVVDAFIAAIHERPEDFRIGEHTINDKKTGLEFWISNSLLDGAVYRPYKLWLGIVQSIRFRWWVRKFKAARTVYLLTTGKADT